MVRFSDDLKNFVNNRSIIFHTKTYFERDHRERVERSEDQL